MRPVDGGLGARLLIPPIGEWAGTFEEWRTEQLCILKQIARLASAHFQDPTDPANTSKEALLLHLALLHQHYAAGAARGWQQ